MAFKINIYNIYSKIISDGYRTILPLFLAARDLGLGKQDVLPHDGIILLFFVNRFVYVCEKY